MAKTKKAVKKSKTAVNNKISQRPAAASRKLKKPAYRSFKLSKRVKSSLGQPANVFAIFKECLKHLNKFRRLFLGITLTYLGLTILLVKGFGNSLGISEIKTILEENFDGVASSLVTGVSLFGELIRYSGSTASQVGGVYQTVLVVLTSLALIWALRQTHSDKKVSVKTSFYNSTYPLIPFLLVGLVVCLQLLPLVAGSWLYSVVIVGGIAVTAAEQFIWLLLIGGLVLLSFYMLTSSLFALYIVTLPEMTPLKALRSARSIVRYRRWTVMRKILALPVLLLIVSGLIMVPVIILLTPIAEWTFFFLNMAMLAIVHSYMYVLYRQLL